MISRRLTGGLSSGRPGSVGRSGIGRSSVGRPTFDDADESVNVERRLSRSPIYEGSGPFTGAMPRAQPPRLLRDQLYDRMCDWRAHTIAEMESWLPGNKWVEAMIDLITFGFAFEREVRADGCRALRLRKREPYERRQQVVDILSGMTLPDRIVTLPGAVLPPITSRTEEVVEPRASREFVDEGQWTPPPDIERMVLDTSGDIVLSVPDLVTDTIGILARKGAGKTYLAMVIAEEFLASTFSIPFVVLDPMGVWWGLLSDVEGNPTERRLVVFGGAHGHYPLTSRDGGIMAKMVVACRPLPFVFDLSAFPREEQHRFCADFSAELFLVNKEPLHIFLDEADGFAPQRLEGKSSRHQKRSLAEIDCLVRRGRVHGLGMTLITQRPAVISKNVLSQVGAMFFLETGAPHDLRAIDDWLHDRITEDVRRQCREELPVLGPGQAFYLRGGEHYRFCKFTVRSKKTYDSSLTPRIGDKRPVAKTYALTDEDRRLLDGAMAAARSGVFVAANAGDLYSDDPVQRPSGVPAGESRASTDDLYSDDPVPGAGSASEVGSGDPGGVDDPDSDADVGSGDGENDGADSTVDDDASDDSSSDLDDSDESDDSDEPDDSGASDDEFDESSPDSEQRDE
jgi:hypothetical protein